MDGKGEIDGVCRERKGGGHVCSGFEFSAGEVIECSFDHNYSRNLDCMSYLQSRSIVTDRALMTYDLYESLEWNRIICR